MPFIDDYHIRIYIMKDKTETLRKTLSANIKKHREFLGITQEKLAEKAGISANMINDIEGCRSWISDKTLVNIASALQVETYCLFIPISLSDTEIDKTALNYLAKDLKKSAKTSIQILTMSSKPEGLKGKWNTHAKRMNKQT